MNRRSVWTGCDLPDDELIYKRILNSRGHRRSKLLTNKPKKLAKTKEVNKEVVTIRELRKIGLNSLLVKWTPSGLASTIGYAVFINKKLRSRIYNRMRNMTVLDYLPLNSLFVICIKEIGSDGRESSQGASTVYKITF